MRAPWPMNVVVALTLAGCGVAPVHRGKDIPGPPTWRYVGTHGRPLAFHGGVCAIAAPHPHEYPPSPREAFTETAEGWRDTRKTWPFFDAHPHRGRTCFREGWHLHLEAPDPSLVRDDDKAAWRAAEPLPALKESASGAR